MLLVNQISVFFSCQYLINGFTSDSDILHVDIHERTQQDLLMAFLKKYLSGQTGHFGPKNGASS